MIIAKKQLNGGTYPTEQLKNAVIPEDKELVKNENGTYSIVDKKADFTKLDEAINKAKEALKEKEKYTKESIKTLEEALKADNEDLRALKIANQDLVDKVTKAINDAVAGLKIKDVKEENPNTYDAGMSYMGLALLSFGTMIALIKKLRNN